MHQRALPSRMLARVCNEYSTASSSWLHLHRFSRVLPPRALGSRRLFQAVLDFLSEELSEVSRLAAALQPLSSSERGSIGGLCGGPSVGDSLLRTLLHVDALQSEVGAALLQLLPEHQHTSAAGGMPMSKAILSQFRWLERVVDGAALVGAVFEMMQARRVTSAGQRMAETATKWASANRSTCSMRVVCMRDT
eukprot:1069144-Pleurochrysis_carterae.AAC.1